MAALIVAVVGIILVTIWFFQSSRNKELVNKLPGPPALPLIGNAHQLSPSGADFYGQLLQFAETYKEEGMFRIWLGVVPVIALYKAELSEVILNSTKHIDKAFMYRFLHPWLGTGLLTSTGKKWHGRRKMLTPTFHFKILTDFVLVFNEQAQILKEKLRSKVGSKPFNIFPDITLCALDIICETAMGRNINAQSNSDSAYVSAVYKMSTILLKRMRSPWYWPSVLFNTFGSGNEHDKCLSILHSFTKKVILEKKQELSSRRETGAVSREEEEVVGRKKRLAFMDMLLHMSDDGAILSDDDIREEVDTFMFEGHDTTAAAMNWAVFLISSNTRIQQKLHEELDSVFGDSEEPATMENLKDLKYLESCIKEALRLYPSVPSFARTLTDDADIGGLVIPKHTSVVLLTSALHRDPLYFPDPEVFNPDRFLPENIKNRHPYSYVPFSAGMRNCIGQKFALLEEKVILSTIFRNFTVKTHQKREDLKPVGDLILRPEEGIFVTLRSRT
ncbi:cytochrome P450 4V2-like [Haliotis rufescens]|uniref:cytochrome P450 4V2-like n=1 Tax=Haliotis rufescens TaxID=6454 RepID=UPI00201E7B1C|nr:cytochrome P450 4V2-like [Haliotis rufescens]